jgi:PAS domain S-box-containing protein
VLVAEDNAISLHILYGLLAQNGYDVIRVGDGTQALEILESDSAPPLAVLDWSMPGFTGPEICRRVKQSGRPQRTHIILLAASDQENAIDRHEAAADDYLMKPVDSRELRARLQVGARIMAERALRESEERFRRAFECTAVGLALIDSSRRWLLVNPAFCDFVGYTREELIGSNFLETTYAEDRDRSAANFQQLAERKTKTYSYEKRYRHKQGHVVWASVTVSPLPDTNETAANFVCHIQDITRRKQAEEALRRSEALAHAITENVEDLIAIIDFGRKYVYASPSHLTALGYSPEELVGRDIFDVIHPDDQKKVQRATTGVMGSGQAHGLNLRLRCKGGGWKHIESRGTVIRNGQGAGDALVVVSRLVDERMAAEAALAAAHTETEAFLQAVPSILIGLDSQACITRWNRMAGKTFGASEDAVRGHTLCDCGIKWLRFDMAAETRRWLRAPSVCQYNDLAYEKDNKIRFVSLRVHLVNVAQDGQPGFIITGADITARKCLEEQLRQAQKLEAVGQLAAGVAHEINTPTQYVSDNTRFFKDSWTDIANVLASAQLIRNEAETGSVQPQTLAAFDAASRDADLDYLVAEIPKAIDHALEGLDRVARIVRAMKEFSHPGVQEKRPIDVNRAIETTLTVARNEWKYVADAVTQFDPELPLVPGLRGELNQAFLNLILNAAHAIADVVGSTTQKGTITISTSRRGDWAQIVISDTGTGIPENIRSRIFEPFFTTKPVGKGTGQGLTLAHSVIVKQHQGRIWFESVMGKGTSFFIQLPLSVDEANDKASAIC